MNKHEKKKINPPTFFGVIDLFEILYSLIKLPMGINLHTLTPVKLKPSAPVEVKSYLIVEINIGCTADNQRSIP